MFVDVVVAVAAHPHQSILASGALDGDKTVRLWRIPSEGDAKEEDVTEEKADESETKAEDGLNTSVAAKKEESEEAEEEEEDGDNDNDSEEEDDSSSYDDEGGNDD